MPSQVNVQITLAYILRMLSDALDLFGIHAHGRLKLDKSAMHERARGTHLAYVLVYTGKCQ